MKSIYIHIPFCSHKCDYCNFFVIAEDEINKKPELNISKIKSEYISSLKKEIDIRYEKTEDHEVRTIYFGGGTPGSIGKDGLCEIIDHIYKHWNVEFLEEISIELNPNPFLEMLELVKYISRKYEKNCPRVRFSFGIQSLDDEVLKLAGREYVANNIVGFARELQKIKMSHNIYNFDFICFGSELKANRKEWLEKRMASGMADSRSVYMLELFTGSVWHNMYHNINEIKDPKLLKLVNPDEDAVMDEYAYWRDILTDMGYVRYEVSNWTKPGSQSIHNTVYWNMGEYIGIGASASGFVNNIRYTNTTNIRQYIKGNYRDETKDIHLNQSDIMFETIMLGLRTVGGVKNISQYKEVLRSDYIDYINDLTENGLAIYDEDKLLLSHDGMDVANRIISELLK